MTDKTLGALIAEHDRTVLDHLALDVGVPLVEMGRQGDVLVVPNRVKPIYRFAVEPLRATGHPAVKGAGGAAVHLLVGEGDVRFDARPASSGELTLGFLSVREGASAYLIHPEHGALGFVPGEYTVLRQRELADEIRLVED